MEPHLFSSLTSTFQQSPGDSVSKADRHPSPPTPVGIPTVPTSPQCCEPFVSLPQSSAEALILRAVGSWGRGLGHEHGVLRSGMSALLGDLLSLWVCRLDEDPDQSLTTLAPASQTSSFQNAEK